MGELKQLKYFVAVAKHLHFGRAAAELNMAQPPLSQQIARLEQELGIELFRRTSRKVTLTPDGEQLLPAAQRTVDESQHVFDMARRLRMGESGSIRVGFAFSTLNWGLAARLRSFREAFPRVEITVQQMRLLDQVESIGNGTIDVGFSLSRVDFDHLAVDQLAAEPIVAVLPTGHPLAELPEVPLTELASETFVGFHTDEHGEEKFDNYISRACIEGGFLPDFTYHGEQIHTMVNMVAAGFGVTLIPGCDQVMHVDGVMFRPLAPPVPTVDLTVMRHRHDTTSAVERLVAHMLDGSQRHLD